MNRPQLVAVKSVAGALSKLSVLSIIAGIIAAWISNVFVDQPGKEHLFFIGGMVVYAVAWCQGGMAAMDIVRGDE